MTSIVGVEKYRIMVGVRGGAALGPIPSGLGVDKKRVLRVEITERRVTKTLTESKGS